MHSWTRHLLQLFRIGDAEGVKYPFVPGAKDVVAQEGLGRGVGQQEEGGDEEEGVSERHRERGKSKGGREKTLTLSLISGVGIEGN